MARLAFMGDIARAGVWDMSAMTEGARDTANAMRLVTAVTGAVVLENAEQYARHGLDPSANSRSVPTIPEPEEYALMAVTCALLAVTYVRRRRQRRA